MDKLIKVEQIIEFLDVEIICVFGNPRDVYICNIQQPENVDSKTLDWINFTKQDKQQIAEQSKAKVIICDPSVIYSEFLKSSSKVLIQVNNPKMIIALIVERFFVDRPQIGIHPTAIIHPEAKISTTAYIGPGCVLGNCFIGENAIIHPNVTIYDSTKIGKNVLIHAGTVIGTDGLGCERKEDGTLIKFPHLGGVNIGNNVEIGANCQIAKGALTDTIIGDGTKINGLCFIAHNCILGKNVWITGDSMLAGSVKIEDNVTIFSKVIIREQRIIGCGATIGMGAVVTKNVPEGETWVGNPARKMT